MIMARLWLPGRRPRPAALDHTLIGIPHIARGIASVPPATLPTPSPSPMLDMPQGARASVTARGRHRADGTEGSEGRDMILASDLTAQMRTERAKREAPLRDRHSNVYPQRDPMRDTWESTLVLRHHSSRQVRRERRRLHTKLMLVGLVASCQYLVNQVHWR